MNDHDDLGFVPDTAEHDDLGFVADQQSKSTTPSSALTNVGDIGQGVAQGLTFGFADELAAALGAAGKKGLEAAGVIDEDKDEKNLAELYRQYQQTLQKGYEEAKERSPWLTGIGEVAGGVVSPVTAGLGLGKAGLTAGQAAVRGAGAGALQALGSSKGTVEASPEQLAKDVAIGGTAGGLIGGATQGIINKISKGGAAIKERLSPEAEDLTGAVKEQFTFPRQLSRSFEEGRAGRGFVSKGSVERADVELEKATRDLFKAPLEKGEQYAKGLYNEFAKMNTSPLGQEAIPANVLNSLEDAKSILVSDPTARTKFTGKIIDQIDRAMNGELSGAELKNLQVLIKDKVADKAEGLAQQSLYDTVRGIESVLQPLPGYKEANRAFAQSKQIAEGLISKKPLDVESKLISDFYNPQEKIYEEGQDVIQKLTQSNLKGREQGQQLERFKDQLLKVSESNPELFKSLGIADIGQHIKSIKSAADIEAILNTIQGRDSSLVSGGLMGQLVGAGKKFSYGAANLLGQGSAIAQKSAPAQMAKSIYQAGDDTLIKAANALKDTPGLQHLGQGLESAITNKSSAAKNAVIFSIMQNPNARKSIVNILPGVNVE